MSTLSFSVLSDLNVSRFLFLDTSDYSVEPVAPTLYIKFPDFSKEYETSIKHGQINILNTQRLKYSECITDFPDGVYCLRFVTSNGLCEVTDTIFRVTKAERDLEAVLSKGDYSSKDFAEKFNKIQLYLRGAESYVKHNKQQAVQLYKQAVDLINCFSPDVRMYQRECNCQ